MKKLRKNYGYTTMIYRSADYRSLQVTTGHYGHYRHYRFREKVTGFADVVRTTPGREQQGRRIAVIAQFDTVFVIETPATYKPSSSLEGGFSDLGLFF